MTSELDSTAETAREQNLRRRYRTRITMASIIYVVVLAPVTFWGGLGGHSAWRFLFALLPVLPAAWMAAIIIARFRELDEYQVRLAFPGIASALVSAMLASVTIGFLGITGLNLPGVGWIVFVAGMGTWWLVSQLTGAAKQF
ncbi:hypothetical protein [Gryllotalpicola daejeonensis]